MDFYRFLMINYIQHIQDLLERTILMIFHKINLFIKLMINYITIRLISNKIRTIRFVWFTCHIMGHYNLSIQKILNHTKSFICSNKEEYIWIGPILMLFIRRKYQMIADQFYLAQVQATIFQNYPRILHFMPKLQFKIT